MIKKLLLFAILVIIAFHGQAQYKPVLFGLRAGPNLGWVKPDTDGYESEGVVMGFTWGFIGEFFIMENYAIVTGFNVNFNGGKLSYPYQMEIGDDTVMTAGTLERKYQLKYIQIPFCLKMQTDLSEEFRLFGKIGLGTAFNLSGKASDDFTYEGGSESTSKKSIDDEIALMRESLIVGGGVEYIIKGSTAVILELTYDNAFNNMLTGENPALTGTDPKAFHNYVELGVGIVF
jgi:hypothetical protein